MLAFGEETLDGMVKGADPGREPERNRRVQRDFGVVENGARHELGVASASLRAGVVREPRARRQLRDRKGGRNRDVGETTEVPGHDLGRIDGAASAEADNA